MLLPSRAEVVVVGAGLAGLSAATRLSAAGCDVHVVEAAHRVGGRVASERIDDFVVDRGFQVFNTGYPRSADLDLDALRLGLFWPGAVVRRSGRGHRLVDPRRHPLTIVGTLRAPAGSLRDKAAIAAFSARAAYTPVPALLRARERTAAEALRTAGIGTDAVEWFLRPFLAGVLLESELATSSRYLDLRWRSFARGAIGLPAAGMQSIPEQLAAVVPAERLHLRTTVRSVAPSSVATTDGDVRADAVVVAVVGAAARARCPRRPARQQRRAHGRATALQPRRPGAGRELEPGAHHRGGGDR